MGAQDVAQRQEALDQRNKKQRDKKNAKGKVKDRGGKDGTGKKLKAMELLQMAADNTKQDLNRNAMMKEWRQKMSGDSSRSNHKAKKGGGGKFQSSSKSS